VWVVDWAEESAAHNFGRLEVLGDTNWRCKCRSRNNRFPPCIGATPLSTAEWGEEEWVAAERAAEWGAVGWVVELAWDRV
jgi:hypothetical protein